MAESGNDRKKAIREIILDLHRGLTVEEARDRFEQEVGEISSTEIASIEQSLIDEGMSPDEIKKFCNVHALIFQAALERNAAREESPAHPVHLFKLENREIEKITGALQKVGEAAGAGPAVAVREIRALLTKLAEIELHYTRKEQLLFPYLEKAGFMGPSKVMWGKDNEIRDLYKQTLSAVETVATREQLDAFISGTLNPLVEEIEGMIFKEENILFPTSLEKLNTDAWVEILKESDEVGYAFIEKPAETESLIRELKHAVAEEPGWKDERAVFPTGRLSLQELMHILNILPVELTFVGPDDTVRYFTDSANRIFVRTRSVIGRKVQNCHPPQSVDLVEKILVSFKEGARDRAEFWLNFKGRLIYIEFLAVRDRSGNYLGTLEVAQDITGHKTREGEQRLLDQNDRPS
jgi:DUF438 domain-containing protein